MSPGELAAALGASLAELGELAAAPPYHRRTVRGRPLSEPAPELARVQRWIARHLLATLEAHPCSHGFRRGRSTATNARPHVGRRVVVTLDLRGFFPSVTRDKVRAALAEVAELADVAELLAELCTEPDAAGRRTLPQGAPTSPALANLAAGELDAELAELAGAQGWTFTRYADDLAFSGNDAGAAASLIRCVRSIVWRSGFRLNERKTRVMRSNDRQAVCGVVVNEKPSIRRETLRRLRAELHQAGETPEALGRLAHLASIDRERANRMRAAKTTTVQTANDQRPRR